MSFNEVEIICFVMREKIMGLLIGIDVVNIKMKYL